MFDSRRGRYGIHLACLSLLVLTACAATQRAPAQPEQSLWSAEWVESLDTRHRYRVDVSRDHQHEVGQWVVLYRGSTGADSAQAIGYGQVQYSSERTLFVDITMALGDPPRRLSAGPIPVQRVSAR